MYFNHRHVAVLHGIPQRHARVAVAAGIQHDTITFERLYLIYQIAFVIGLIVCKEDIRPALLNLQQNLCHRLRAVNIRLTNTQTIQVWPVEN